MVDSYFGGRRGIAQSKTRSLWESESWVGSLRNTSVHVVMVKTAYEDMILFPRRASNNALSVSVFKDFELVSWYFWVNDNTNSQFIHRNNALFILFQHGKAGLLESVVLNKVYRAGKVNQPEL